jgi:hypothetical protein
MPVGIDSVDAILTRKHTSVQSWFTGLEEQLTFCEAEEKKLEKLL